jgi:hypothetical protein
MAEMTGQITSESIINDLIERLPEAGPILLQHGRMFRAPKGNLYAQFSRMTVADYAAENGLDVEPLVRTLRAAAESAEMSRESAHGQRAPSDPLRRGAAIGYTGAYREPTPLDVEDVVTSQSTRGPD